MTLRYLSPELEGLMVPIEQIHTHPENANNGDTDEQDALFGTAYYGANSDFVSPLFRIDPTTGAATVIGNTGFVNPHGGDYRSAVPEPAAIVLSLLGCSVYGLVRRRCRR